MKILSILSVSFGLAIGNFIAQYSNEIPIYETAIDRSFFQFIAIVAFAFITKIQPE